MVIDWAQVLSIVLGLAGTLVGAWAYAAKGRVQIELEEVRGDNSRFDQMMQLIEGQARRMDKQIEINGTFSASLDKKEKKDEDNYQTLKLVSDRHAQENTEEVRFARDKILERLDLMPERIAAIQVEGLRTITAEMGVMLAEIVRGAITHFDGAIFPTMRDPRWIEAYITPLNGMACLFDEPRSNELAKNITPAGCVKHEERAWVIPAAAPGFHAVRRGNGTYGWLLVSAIRVSIIGNHYPKSESLEVQGEKVSSGNVDSGDADNAGVDAASVRDALTPGPSPSGRGGSDATAGG